MERENIYLIYSNAFWFAYVSKHIPSKKIPSGTEEPLKETKMMHKDKNDKQVRTITGGAVKKNICPETKSKKWVCTYTD